MAMPNTPLSMTDGPEADPSAHKATPEWSQLEVHYLILQTEGFIVFLDPALDVDWKTTPEYDAAAPKDLSQRNEILNRAASLECVPNDHHKKNVRLNFKRMLGEGVARSLDSDYDSANGILDQAQAYIGDRNVETARVWQLSTGCGLGIVVAFGAVLLWMCRVPLIGAWGESAYFLLLAAAAGCLGAVLSMIFRMGDSFPTSEAPKTLHMLEAASRVFAGSISGILIAGSVEIGLILPVFERTGELHGAMLVAAMASGASERWAPSLIARLEGSSKKNQMQKGKAK
jgi:hypothetical protein